MIRPRFLERFEYLVIKTLVDVKGKDQRNHTVDKNMISEYAHVSCIDHNRFAVVIAVIWPCTLVTLFMHDKYSIQF